ncbi:MAG: COG3650 family protein [Gemmatimonadaceae bacterium]
MIAASWRGPLGLAVTLATAACGGAPKAPAADTATAAAPVALRGTLLARDSVTLVFVACGTTAERPLELRRFSQVIEALVTVNGAVRDSIYLELHADTAGGRLRAREARFATSFAEGSRCDRPRPYFDIEATGNEPFWHVTLDGTQLVLERGEAPHEIAFVADTPVVRGGLTTILAHRDEGRARDLQLGLLRTTCRDGMSDAWYPYRAEVRFGTMALHGCARR